MSQIQNLGSDLYVLSWWWAGSSQKVKPYTSSSEAIWWYPHSEWAVI